MTNPRNAYFTVPDGTTYDPLEFTGLTAGTTYRMKFTVGGTVQNNNNFRLRPGGSGVDNDVYINALGDYDVTFTVDPTPGYVRFVHEDITWVHRVEITDIYIYELIESG